MPLFLWPDKVKLALTVYQWLDLCLLVSSDYWHSDMCWPQWDLYFSISLLLWTEKLNWQSNGGRWRDPCLLGGPGQARQWNDTTFWQWPFISDLTKWQWHVCMIYQNLSNKHAIEGTWTYHEVVFSLNFSWPSPTQCWLVRPPFFLNSPFVFKHNCQLHEPILHSTQSSVFLTFSWPNVLSWPSPTQCRLVRPPFSSDSPFVFKHMSHLLWCWCCICRFKSKKSESKMLKYLFGALSRQRLLISNFENWTCVSELRSVPEYESPPSY